MDMRKYIPILLTIPAIIISLSMVYYLVVFIPQKESMKIDLERQKLEQDRQKALKEEQTANENTMLLNLCLSNAEKERWEYLKLNGTVKTDEDGSEKINASQRFFDYADKVMKASKDDCFRKYVN